MRILTLLFCGALAGCAGASAGPEPLTPEPMAQATPAPAQPSGPKARNTRTAKLKDADAPHDEWWKEGGVTREKISAMCWMKYEKGHADLPIDKRADLVNTCVADTLKQHPLN